MRTIRVTTTCTADLTEHWSLRVPDDYPIDLEEFDLDEVLRNKAVEIVSVSEESDNERDREVEGIEVIS